MIDHHDSYTYNLVHLIAAVTGVLPDVIQHDDRSQATAWRSGYSHIVLSPGPGTVNDADDFMVGRAVLAGATVPVLGVCLGMQGLVVEFGGRVEVVEPAHGEVASVHHTGVGLFAHLPQGFAAVRYHSLAAVEVPAELEVTAWCQGVAGQVTMGVAHRSRPLVGVQFHPESVLTVGGRRLIESFVST